VSDWKAGDRAIYVGPKTLWCVNGKPWQAPYKENAVYTVDRVCVLPDFSGAPTTMLVFVPVCTGGTQASLFVKPPSETHFKHLLADTPRESEAAS